LRDARIARLLLWTRLPRLVSPRAEFALALLDSSAPAPLGSGAGDGVYRLLFRAMASDPEEVRRFYSETVEPLVTHDREYRTDLMGTLEAYLSNDCNMNATARAVYAHRHTVAHRLARIRDLSGLDPAAGEDRERLGLGIKASASSSRRCLASSSPRFRPQRDLLAESRLEVPFVPRNDSRRACGLSGAAFQESLGFRDRL